MSPRAPFIVQVAPPAKEGESGEYRNFLAPKAPITTPLDAPPFETVHELISWGCKHFNSKPILGQRKFIQMHVEEKEIKKIVDGEEVKVKRDWQYYEMGHYNWQSFTEHQEFRKVLGAALLKTGFKPHEDKFHLYAKTCREWMQMATALVGQSIPLVTAYDTLGIEGLRESINKTGTRGILLDKENLGNLLTVLADAPSIKVVVYRDMEGPLTDKNKQQIEKIKGINGGIDVYGFTEFAELGQSEPAEFNPPSKEDICCIMYTSGSTGPPKGVVLLNSTVLAGIAGAEGNVRTNSLRPGDVCLGILPLAHILEFTAELTCFVWGMAIGYGTPKTITDTNMRNSLGDMRELRPTVLIAVPAVWELIKKGVMHKVGAASGVAQKVFWGSYKLKSALRSLHLPSGFLDSLVFKGVKEATGGRMRCVMSGGAPVSVSTRHFVNTLIAPLVMGYGLTETNAMCALESPETIDSDTTGYTVASITIKLVDVPDAGYFAKNHQGELWVKGPAVSPGYWKNEKETAEAYTEDGWFKTGDVVELTPSGKTKVIDRKKNLIKTLNGEYIAVERLEALYRSNKYVANICVFADSYHVKPVAVVVPMEPALKELAGELGLEFSHTVYHNKKVIRTIINSLQETAKENSLRPVEWIADLVLSDEEWTPENGFVSSAQKVQRKKIGEEYKQGIEKAFESA